MRRVKGARDIIHTTSGKKTDWIGHISGRNCLPKYFIEGKIEGRIEVKGRRGRRRWQLVNERKERVLEIEK